MNKFNKFLTGIMFCFILCLSLFLTSCQYLNELENKCQGKWNFSDFYVINAKTQITTAYNHLSESAKGDLNSIVLDIGDYYRKSTLELKSSKTNGKISGTFVREGRSTHIYWWCGEEDLKIEFKNFPIYIVEGSNYSPSKTSIKKATCLVTDDMLYICNKDSVYMSYIVYTKDSNAVSNGENMEGALHNFLLVFIMIIFSIIAYPFYPLIICREKFDMKEARKRALLNCLVVHFIGALVYVLIYYAINKFVYYAVFFEGLGYMLIFSVIFFFFDKWLLYNKEEKVAKRQEEKKKIEKINCPKCGNKLNADEKYCDICGADIQENPDESDVENSNTSETQKDDFDFPIYMDDTIDMSEVDMGDTNDMGEVGIDDTNDMDEVDMGDTNDMDEVDMDDAALDNDITYETNNASETVESVGDMDHGEKTPEKCPYCGGELKDFSSDMLIYIDGEPIKKSKGKICLKCGNIVALNVEK